MTAITIMSGTTAFLEKLTFIQKITLIFYGLIACNGCYGEEINSRMMGGQQYGDGVVMARVAIEDDFVLHVSFTFGRREIVSCSL